MSLSVHDDRKMYCVSLATGNHESWTLVEKQHLSVSPSFSWQRDNTLQGIKWFPGIKSTILYFNHVVMEGRSPVLSCGCVSGKLQHILIKLPVNIIDWTGKRCGSKQNIMRKKQSTFNTFLSYQRIYKNLVQFHIIIYSLITAKDQSILSRLAKKQVWITGKDLILRKQRFLKKSRSHGFLLVLDLLCSVLFSEGC